jgi:isoleucyl-tRNA synthetase
MSPQKVVNNLGADILRLWIAGSDYTGEMTVSDEILKRSADSYRRIRNTMRFILANTAGFNPKTHQLNEDKILDLDKWIMSKTANLQIQILQAYEHYNFHQVIQLILNFCSNDLGGFYLDVIKDRQYTTQENSIARRSAQTALNHILETMVRWLAPVLSFTAEEIWQSMPDEKNDSIFLQEWYQVLDASYSNKAIDTARAINPFIRKQMEQMRHDKIIGSSLDAEVDIYCDDNTYKLLEKLGDELRFVFITSYARIHPISKKNDACVENCQIGEKWRFDDYSYLCKGLHYAYFLSSPSPVKVTQSESEKCVRCWHHREDIGSNNEHPELCSRPKSRLSVFIIH